MNIIKKRFINILVQKNSDKKKPMWKNGVVECAKLLNQRMCTHYIRLRYAYQMIRLAHYMKDYEYTLDLYDFFMPKIDDKNSLIYYWIIGHRAGALRALGRNVEASYLYTQIFSKCPNRRQSAFHPFRMLDRRCVRPQHGDRRR